MQKTYKRPQYNLKDNTAKVNEVEKHQPLPRPQFKQSFAWPTITLSIRASLEKLDVAWEQAMRLRDSADRVLAKQAIVDCLVQVLGKTAADETVAVMREKQFRPSAAANVAWQKAQGVGRANSELHEVEQVARQKAVVEIENIAIETPIVKTVPWKDGKRYVYSQRKWAHGQVKPSGLGPRMFFAEYGDVPARDGGRPEGFRKHSWE